MLDSLRDIHPALPTLTTIVGLLLFALIADIFVRRLLPVLTRIALKHTVSTWDDALVHQNVFRWFAQIVPGLIVYTGLGLIPASSISTFTGEVLRNITVSYIALMVTFAIAAMLRAINEIYEGYAVAKDRPIKGFIQLAIVIVYIIGAILIVSALIDRSPLILLSGVGAMTAVLLLVFKDTLLSLVASIQLTGQDMLKVGDWLEMPAYNADGDVIDIALYTVTVQNWDKTITRIPTHALITNSFKNWRGMTESGGRRIKRSINIDLNSTRFLSEEEVERFKKVDLLHDYMIEKQSELQQHNSEINIAEDSIYRTNRRNLTNVGTFRAYVINYLRKNPNIHNDMTLIVRQLQPTAEGLPLEIYAFSNETDWAVYEDIQGDIFDHILAVAPEFGIKLYQQPSGSDFKELLSNPSEH